MIQVTLAAIMHLSLAVGSSDDYAEAHRKTEKTGQPMVVMVGAEWCPACVQMERNVLPRIRERGILARVAFAKLNYDHNPELCQQLTGGGPIPQLIVFRRVGEGWRKRKLIGGQTTEQVEEFIATEVAEQEAEKTAAKPAESEQPADGHAQKSEKGRIRPVSTPVE